MQLRLRAIGVGQKLFLALVTLTIIGAGAQVSFAEDARSTGLHDRLPGEDPSCDIVNRSYERTVRGNFATRIYSVEPTGVTDIFETDIYIGRLSRVA